MEQKTLLLAIVLSAIIMVGFQWYSANQRPPEAIQTIEQQKAATTKPGTASTPTLPGGTTLSAPSGTPGMAVPIPGVNDAAAKAEALKKALTSSPRLRIETDRVRGSISLIGARIDDLTLKDYNETIEAGSKNISLLLPFGSDNPYYSDFGWVSADTKVPDANTVWTASSQTLTSKAPVTLSWQNASLGWRMEKR